MDKNTLITKLAELMALPDETECVEFKEAKSRYDFDKLGQYFSALSNEANLKNKSCGWLVFGVNKQHDVIGTAFKPIKTDLNQLKHSIADHTTARITFIEIHELKHPDGRVIMFQIPAAPPGIPVVWKGFYYGRDGDALTGLNIQKIEQIRNQARRHDWSAQVCKGATIDEFDSGAVLKAREEYKQKYPTLAGEVDSWDDRMFLNKAKITVGGEITNTAILLLGKSEAEHFVSPSVACISWILENKDCVKIDYIHLGPPFIISVDKLFSKIRNLQYRYLPDGTLFPTEITQYDPWVIREALHNCIAHQDYELRGRINVVERPYELIFTNVGSFIPGSVEKVIEEDSPPVVYRNRFLAQAMVNINMIDTIGSGIKNMFQKQKQRFFPLPSYDLTQSDRVIVKIQGTVLNESYTRLLIANPDMELHTVILLDKVQKGIRLSKDEHKFLKSKKLVEGRYPNLFVSSRIAAAVEERAKYTKYKGFDDQHYKDMIIAFIKEYGFASRKDINELLLDKLPDALGEQQKRNKISNLLYAMSGKEKTIMNNETRRRPKWVLSE